MFVRMSDDAGSVRFKPPQLIKVVGNNEQGRTRGTEYIYSQGSKKLKNHKGPLYVFEA